MLFKCLSSATAFGYSSLYITWYEQQGKGLSWPNIFVSPIPNDNMSFGLTILIMALDGLAYGLMGWYVKSVFPSTYIILFCSLFPIDCQVKFFCVSSSGNYGSRKPWYFIFAPKLWIAIFGSGSSKTTDEYLKDRSFRGERRGKCNICTEGKNVFKILIICFF